MPSKVEASLDWFSPTGYVGWKYEERAYDDDNSTYARTNPMVGPHSWSAWLCLGYRYPGGTVCDKIRYWGAVGVAYPSIEIWVHKDGSWVMIYNGTISQPQSEWKEVTFSEGNVDEAKFKIHNGSPDIDYAYMREFDFRKCSEEWISPTGYKDPDSGWMNEERAYDESTSLYARTSSMVGPRSWSPWLHLNHSAMTCDRIRYWGAVGLVYPSIEIWVHKDGSWVMIYNGTISGGWEWEKVTFSVGNVDEAKFKIHNGAGQLGFAYMHEFDFGKYSEEWVSPTVYVGWKYEERAYDDDNSTYARTNPMVGPHSWSAWLRLSYNYPTGTVCDRIRCWGAVGVAYPSIEIWVHKDGSWVMIYNGTISGGWEWKEVTFSVGNVDEAKFKILNDSGDIDYAYMCEFDFGKYSGGGCPYVSTWDGNQYLLDNNLLPASEVSGGADVEDHYRLEQTLVPRYEGRRFSWYSLMISEFENEHSYLDQVKLSAIDHGSDVEVAVSPSGEILTYRNPHSPVTCVDNNGYNMLDVINAIDNNYYESQPNDYLIIDFGNLDVSQGAKLVMRADLEHEKWSIRVQILNESQHWETVSTLIPRTYWATEIIDLSNNLPDANGDLKVRLYFTSNHKLDYVGLDTTPQANITTQHGFLVSAIHSEKGLVTRRLLFNDEVRAELIPNQKIRLTFILVKETGKARTFIIYVEGHYETIP